MDFVQNVPSMKRVLQKQQRKQRQQQQEQQQQYQQQQQQQHSGGDFDENDEDDEDDENAGHSGGSGSSGVSLNREFKLRMKNARDSPSSSSSATLSSSSSTAPTGPSKALRGIGACDVLISYRSDDRSDEPFAQIPVSEVHMNTFLALDVISPLALSSSSFSSHHHRQQQQQQQFQQLAGEFKALFREPVLVSNNSYVYQVWCSAVRGESIFTTIANNQVEKICEYFSVFSNILEKSVLLTHSTPLPCI